MKIFIVRHGKTEYNKKFLMQGWVDSVLHQDTIIPTIKVGEGLKREGIDFDMAFSSDLQRAYETARLILKGMNQRLEIIRNKNIKEIDFGEAGGQNVDQVWTSVARKNGFKTREAFNKEVKTMDRLQMLKDIEDYKNAEDPKVFSKRVSKGLHEIINIAKEENAENILIVTHTISIISLLNDLGIKDITEKDVENLSVTCIILNDSKLSVEYMNRKYD